MVRLGQDWILQTGPSGGRRVCCLPLAELTWLCHAFSAGFDAAGTACNLGLHVGDEAAAVRDRRARLLADLGLEPASLVAGDQVHGTMVAVVGEAERGLGSVDQRTALPATDGLATCTPGLTLSVYYADCAPLLLVDPETRAVAAVHAGWRGSVAGIARRAVETMIAAFAAQPGRLLAAIGPAIGPCCYEVGPEPADRVPAAARDVALVRGAGWRIPPRSARAQFLVAAGERRAPREYFPF